MNRQGNYFKFMTSQHVPNMLHLSTQALLTQQGCNLTYKSVINGHFGVKFLLKGLLFFADVLLGEFQAAFVVADVPETFEPPLLSGS